MQQAGRLVLGTLGPDIRDCAAYIKFLDESLRQLPEKYVFQGQVQRGVKYVFPSPDNHDVERYFSSGALLRWSSFKSTSTELKVMNDDKFCGQAAGPRTIFTVKLFRGYRITVFSAFQGEGEVKQTLPSLPSHPRISFLLFFRFNYF